MCRTETHTKMIVQKHFLKNTAKICTIKLEQYCKRSKNVPIDSLSCFPLNLSQYKITGTSDVCVTVGESEI